MRRLSAPAAALLVLALAAGATGAAGVEATDGLGRTVRLPQPALRVVTLAPHTTELVFATGCGARVVGVSAWSDHPPAARRLPRVGDAFRVDLERIVALRAELAVAWASGLRPRQRARLEALGVAVYLSAPRRVADVARELEGVGRLVGCAEGGRRAAARLRASLAALAARRPPQPVPVLVLVSARPLLTVGPRHFMADVVRLAGGRPLFDGLATDVARLDPEAVAARRPPVVVAPDSVRPADVPAAAGLGRARWIRLPAALIARPGPRLVEGARLLASRLHDRSAAAPAAAGPHGLCSQEGGEDGRC